jgi:hypothetical protein
MNKNPDICLARIGIFAYLCTVILKHDNQVTSITKLRKCYAPVGYDWRDFVLFDILVQR